MRRAVGVVTDGQVTCAFRVTMPWKEKSSIECKPETEQSAFLKNMNWWRFESDGLKTKELRTLASQLAGESGKYHKLKLNSMAWVHKRTIPTDWATAACRRS
jgi:hypothetical protein